LYAPGANVRLDLNLTAKRIFVAVQAIARRYKISPGCRIGTAFPLRMVRQVTQAGAEERSLPTVLAIASDLLKDRIKRVEQSLGKGKLARDASMVDLESEPPGTRIQPEKFANLGDANDAIAIA
jgi:hypothetical protein